MFGAKKSELPRLPVAVNLDAIGRELKVPNPPPYGAPRQHRDDITEAVNKIQSFAELPAKALDDEIAGLEEELAAIKRESQKIRDAYMDCANHLRSVIKEVHGMNAKAKEAIASWRDMLDTTRDLPPYEKPTIREVERPHVGA